MRKLHKVLNFIFPLNCFFCNEEISGKNFCYKCYSFFSRILTPYCDFCQSTDNILNCCEKLFKISSVFEYNKYSGKIIKDLKYHGKTEYAKIMAEEILYHNKSLFEKCDILLPVPSTFMKRFFRKYNPSALICIYIISLLRKRGNEPAYLPFLLKRRGFRKSQVYLSKKNRLENLEKVFYIKKGKEFLSGLNVIVIDDVITTGATARAIGSEILKYNPLSLSFLTFAKTLLR